ncbi:MAG: hypothetical protein K8R76_08440, partial [Candidatus Aegiribacteria sp.]|nr:hypothetical protein [Candidatus Aegiribacteria sp.]
ARIALSSRCSKMLLEMQTRRDLRSNRDVWGDRQNRSGGVKQRTTVGRTSAVRCGRAFNRNF